MQNMEKRSGVYRGTLRYSSKILRPFNSVERNKTERRKEEKSKLPREGGWVLEFLSVCQRERVFFLREYFFLLG